MWENLLVKLLPLGVYKSIRGDIADIFSAAIHQYPPAQTVFEKMSLQEVRQFADKNANDARNYDPHESFNEFEKSLSRIYKLVETLLIACILFGTLSGAGLIVAYSRGVLKIIESVGQILIAIIIGGPTVLVLPAGVLLLYFRLLAFNSFVVGVLNRALLIGPGKTNTRNKQKLIGYGMWNSSLNGGAALQLLVIFSVLWLFSAVNPRWDPYGFMKRTVSENFDVFAHSDGTIDVTKRILSRIRRQESNE
jgi:hypothetical protein